MLFSVCIGINEYQDSRIARLKYARQDAQSLMDMLVGRIHPSDHWNKTLVDAEATRHNIVQAVGEELPRMVGPGDIVLIYFAGHGSPETSGGPDKTSRFLVAYDTPYDLLYSRGINLERDLGEWFDRLREPSLVIQIIDACFSGQGGGRTFMGPKLAHLQSEERTRELIHVSDFDLGNGRLVLAACGHDQLAREDPTLRHGVFTHYLLEGLKTPQAGERTVSVFSLYEQVAKRVRVHTAGKQIPIINGRADLPYLPVLADED